MTEIATIDWFGRWGRSVFSGNTAIFVFRPKVTREWLSAETDALMLIINNLVCFLKVADDVKKFCTYTFRNISWGLPTSDHWVGFQRRDFLQT